MSGPKTTRLAPIDRSSFEPAYLQLANILSRAIATGQYRAGDQIPTEAELRAVYEVSPMTVRRAINLLLDRGAVITTRGRGTFVKPLQLAAATFELREFHDLLDDPRVEAGGNQIERRPDAGGCGRLVHESHRDQAPRLDPRGEIDRVEIERGLGHLGVLHVPVRIAGDSGRAAPRRRRTPPARSRSRPSPAGPGRPRTGSVGLIELYVVYNELAKISAGRGVKIVTKPDWPLHHVP